MSFLTRFSNGLGLTLLALALGFGAPVAAQDRSITLVKDDLYRFKNNFHYSVFLVTDEGVIATDPIDAEAAHWLETEIRKRFDKEIRYVIYSHDHRDHIAGGEVWADTATIVAHERAKDVIIGENRPTAVPDITFRDRMTIELGGKKVELYYPGRSHSDNLIVMLFPAERALFTVDFISVDRLPYRDLSDSYLPDWMDAIDYVTRMDFDILMPGHGAIGTKQDAANHGRYLKQMYQQVLAGARAGKTMEQLQKEVTMDAYSNWGQYEAWRELNIKGMYERIQANRRGN